MDSFESKKLALLRIWQILKDYSDCDHPMTQEEIARKLDHEYGIVIERKAIGRNISLLKEAGVEIESVRAGSYLAARDFEDSELHMLIDGVLGSRYITANHSKDLIDRLCSLSNKYFRSSVKHIHSVNDWSKTDNQALFYNIELIDDAIEKGKRIQYDYNKYGADKKLHKSSRQDVTPYMMILHNQHYYLMAFSERYRNMVFHRLDRVTNMLVSDEKATPIEKVPGYERGIDFRALSSSMPYMYTDKPEHIDFIADAGITDQIIDWFGNDVRISKTEDENKVKVGVRASPTAMEYWALQYLNHVEIVSPQSLRERLKSALEKGAEKYK